MTADVGLMSW